MHRIVNNNFAFAIIILIAACIGFYFYLDNANQEISDEIKITKNVASANMKKDNKTVMVTSQDWEECENVDDDMRRKIKELESQIYLMNDNLVEPLKIYNQKIDHWNVYENSEHGFSVEYPNTFLMISGDEYSTGRIVLFMSFDADAKNLEGNPNPGFFSQILISYWDDINNDYLKGGSWIDEKEYSNLDNLFNDEDNHYVTKVSEIELAGKKAYNVALFGDGQTDAIMFEGNGGYYRIEFTNDIYPLSEDIKKEFLGSFSFHKN